MSHAGHGDEEELQVSFLFAMSHAGYGDEEELQGLTHAEEGIIDEVPDRILKELEGMKDTDELEVDYGSDDDFPGPVPSSAASTDVGKASDINSDFQSTIGKPADECDLEMQPLEVESSKLNLGDRPKKFLYKVWPSRNKFFCRGFCMTGGETELGITPNWSVPNLCVWTCILAPCSLYFLWVFPHLWSQGVYAMPCATLAVFMITSGSLLATCCTDPGIIPRREVVIATKSAAILEAQLGYDLLASDSVPADGRGGGRNLPVELTSRGYRWCRTCRIVRPPRASHCPDCDNCVLRYDHHCPFVNNCVGQRNYHFFFSFVTSVLCLAVMVLPVLFWFLNSDDFEVSLDALTHVSSGVLQPVFIALISAGVLVSVATVLGFVLWIYHAFLIATSRTTKEYRKSVPNVAEEPTLCAARGPRLFDPLQEVDPRDLIRTDETPPPAPSNFCSTCWDDDD